MTKKVVAILVFLLLVFGLVIGWCVAVSRETPALVEEQGVEEEETTFEQDVPPEDDEEPEGDEVSAEDDEEPLTEEERLEAAEEEKVAAFETLTDAWQEPVEKGVAMEDVDAFLRCFRQVPKDRRDECVSRALNLIPDENVFLLTGILMDTSLDPTLLEEIFNDILNRDESVKMPILRQVLKNPSHPCYEDASWIMDSP